MHQEIAALLKNFDTIPAEERKTKVLACIRDFGALEFFVSVLYLWHAAPPRSFFRTLNEISVFPPPEVKEIKTLGIISEYMGCGGIERVLVAQFECFHRMGIRIVLMTPKEYIEGKTFPIPKFIKRIKVPAEIREQGKAISQIITDEKIDAIFFPYITIDHMLFLCSIARIVHKIPFITYYHTSSFLPYNKGMFDHVEENLRLRQYSSLNVFLSPLDANYYSCFGAKCLYLPNPVPFPMVQKKEVRPKRKKILWLGRVVDQKHPLDAIRIYDYILQKIPDAQLAFVGGGPTLDKAKHFAESCCPAGNITFYGAEMDVRKYYLDADVFLSTSEIEGFQMTLVEALSAGLPVVAYELAYQPPHCDENKGIVTVPMYDTFAAADAIVKLLEDDEHYADMSRKALKQAEKYCNFDFEAEWKKIFEAVCTDQVDSLIAPYVSQDKNFRTFLQYFFLYLPIGSNTLIQKIKDPLNTKIRELTSAQTEAGNRIAEQQAQITALNARVAEQQAQITALNARVAELSQPWLKRKIKGAIRCYKENGLVYTVKLLFRKISNKFRKG